MRLRKVELASNCMWAATMLLGFLGIDLLREPRSRALGAATLALALIAAATRLIVDRRAANRR